MSALVETMFAVGKPAWHGTGVTLPANAKLSLKEGILHSGLDWEVGLAPVISLAAAQKAVNACNPILLQPDSDYQYIYRKTDGQIYGIAKDYHPLQNYDAFEWFQPFLDAGTASLHTAGSLSKGANVWILAELNEKPSEIVIGDYVSKFILLSNGHDGKTSIRIGFTPIRVVCANTLAMAIASKASRLIRIRHSDKTKVSMDKIREIMNLANQEFEANAEQLRFLASKQFNKSDIVKFVKTLRGVQDIPDIDLPGKTVNIMEDIFTRIVSGMGQDNPRVKGTWYAAYMGYNEWLNYKSGHGVDTRMNSLWFGPNQKSNEQALQLALSMAA